MLQQAGIVVTIDPFSATKGIYGQLYAALGKLGSTGTGVGPQVGHSHCEQKVMFTVNGK